MEVRLTQNLEGLPRCPQCNVANPLLQFQSIFFGEFTGKGNSKAWATYKCSLCQDLVAARATLLDEARTANMPGFLMARGKCVAEAIVPEPQLVDADLPERPRRYLEQAIEAIHAPDGAIMLAGSAIDAMLKLKGYKDGSVFSRINKAVDDHVLTEGMSEWAHAVRLESNKPRHADLEEPHATKELAEQTIKFAKALGEFLFVLPARIEKGRAESAKAVDALEAQSDN